MEDIKRKKIIIGKHQWIDDTSVPNGVILQFSEEDIFIKEDFGIWKDFFDDIYHLGHESYPNCNSVGAYCPRKLKHGIK